MAVEKRQSVVDRLGQTLKTSAADGMRQAIQYGKDVATGKKLVEGLSKNDGAFQGWMAHGSTELANMLLHGHPAPVYARSLSPADTEGQPSVDLQQVADQQIAPQASEKSVGIHGPQQSHESSPFQSSLTKLCKACEASIDTPEVKRQISH